MYSFDAVTSLVDYYGFRSKGTKSPDDLIAAIQAALGQHDQRSVFPYIQVHEFEGLLFSDVKAFGSVLPNAPVVDLASIRHAFDTPEDINDSTVTAPSKRIERLIPRYRKVLYGPALAHKIGLQAIRSECPRFDAWLRRLESLSTAR